MRDLVQLFGQQIGSWSEREVDPTRRTRRILKSTDPPGPWKGRYVSVSEWKQRQIREREKHLRTLVRLLSSLQAHNAKWERYWSAVAAEKKRVDREVQEGVKRRRFKVGESRIVDRLRGL
jgi:hypothetical protein